MSDWNQLLNRFQASYTLTLELSSTVLVEFLLINIVGESQWIKEPSRSNDSKLVLETLDGSRDTSLLGRGEGSSRASNGSKGGKFHHLDNY